jgi:hypothetical protein
MATAFIEVTRARNTRNTNYYGIMGGKKPIRLSFPGE